MSASFPASPRVYRAPNGAENGRVEGPKLATLTIQGDLDAESIPSFRDQAFTAIGLRPDILLLDMTGVPFVDTAGLAALVTVARVALRVQVRVMARPAPHLRRVLHVTGLTRILPILETPTEEKY